MLDMKGQDFYLIGQVDGLMGRNRRDSNWRGGVKGLHWQTENCRRNVPPSYPGDCFVVLLKGLDIGVLDEGPKTCCLSIKRWDSSQIWSPQVGLVQSRPTW